MYTVWNMHISTCETVATIKVIDITMTPKVSLCFLVYVCVLVGVVGGRQEEENLGRELPSPICKGT